jgi:hypothetical protein
MNAVPPTLEPSGRKSKLNDKLVLAAVGAPLHGPAAHTVDVALQAVTGTGIW